MAQTEDDPDVEAMLDYMSSEGWKVELDSSAVAFLWQNAFARLRIIHQYGSDSVIYVFEEGEIRSFVLIKYGERLMELLRMISTEKMGLYSGAYTKHLWKITDAFPHIYFWDGSKFGLLVNKDVV